MDKNKVLHSCILKLDNIKLPKYIVNNIILYGNRSFADVIKIRVEMRSYWIRMDPKSNEIVLVPLRKRHTGSQRIDNVKIEAKIRDVATN